MSEKRTPENGDKRLDDLLAGKPVQASRSFAERVLNAAKAPDHEARLDALLTAKPVQPSADFTARTLERCKAEKKTVPFTRHLWAPLAAAAAIAAVAWIALQLENPQSITPVASTQPGTSMASPATAKPAASGTLAQLSNNPDVKELFSLAHGLSKADPLLEESSMETLAMLTRWQ